MVVAETDSAERLARVPFRHRLYTNLRPTPSARAGTLQATDERKLMAWWQLVIVAWGTVSLVLFGVLSTCFCAATEYDTWWYATVSRARSDALLREAA